MTTARSALIILLLACLTVVAGARSGNAQGAPSFQGKTIKLVIPTGPGGAYGLYGLLFAQHYGRHLPGIPSVVPEYRSGAGGMVATNYAYNVAPKDGTTIVMPLAPFVLAQFTAAKQAQYDAAKFIWIGKIGEIVRLLAVWHTSKIRTLDDMRNEEVVAGSTGRGSETYINPALINAVFGTRIRIVDGYKGSSSLLLALERGEVATVTSTWGNFAGNKADWLRDGKVRFIAQIGLKKVAQYQNVPLLSELAKSKDDRELIDFMSLATTAVGYSVMAPPGVPPATVAVLRKAFDATMKDAQFIADAKKRRADIEPAPFNEIEADVAKAMRSPKALIDRFKTALGRS